MADQNLTKFRLQTVSLQASDQSASVITVNHTIF